MLLNDVAEPDWPYPGRQCRMQGLLLFRRNSKRVCQWCHSSSCRVHPQRWKQIKLFNQNFYQLSISSLSLNYYFVQLTSVFNLDLLQDLVKIKFLFNKICLSYTDFADARMCIYPVVDRMLRNLRRSLRFSRSHVLHRLRHRWSGFQHKQEISLLV